MDYEMLEQLSPDVTLDCARDEKQDFNLPNDTERNREERCLKREKKAIKTKMQLSGVQPVERDVLSKEDTQSTIKNSMH